MPEPPPSDNAPLRPPPTDDEVALAVRLHRHVDLLAGVIGPRHMGRPSTLDAAVAYVERELGRHGETVERQAYPVAGQQAINLMLERRGTREPDEVLLLGAHYDTVPETPGADDNASAVAALIEAASLLHGRALRRTVRFVAFANEEPPHFYTQTMGSQVYAAQCKARREKLVGLICLEMIGFFRTDADSQSYPAQLPTFVRPLLRSRGDFIGMVGNLRSKRLLWDASRGFKRAVDFPLIAVPLPQSIHEIRLSDHGPFWDEGFPGVMVTDTSFFRNPHYHLPSDTAETLDYARLSRVTRGIVGAVTHAAGGIG